MWGQTASHGGTNTGTGGGGGKNGGSGVVIIRYASNEGDPDIGAGLAYSGPHIVGDYKYIQFNSGSDTISW